MEGNGDLIPQGALPSPRKSPVYARGTTHPAVPASGILFLGPMGKGRCQPGAEVLQHIPGGIVSEGYVAEVQKEGDRKSLGN